MPRTSAPDVRVDVALEAAKSDPDVTDLRAELYRPVAIQGILVAVLEVDNGDPAMGVNVDMEYVGVEGYTYE